MILCRPGGFDLLERHSFLDHVLNAIANDRHHIAVISDIGGVAEPAMSGNDHGSAFCSELGNGQIQNPVEPVDDALNVSTSLDVNDRIAIGSENVAGRDHVVAPEVNETIAVRVGRWLMQNENALAVEEVA